MKKILVIEDEATISLSLSENLIEAGFEVIESTDGIDGLAKALSIHPDLILLDILMPKMDGLTMLEKLRRDAWGKTVPVMILTNLNDATNVAAAIDSVNEYLVKVDWKVEDIIKRIKEKLKV